MGDAMMAIDYPTLAREIVREQAALNAPVVNRAAAEVIVGRRGRTFYDWLEHYYGAPRQKDGRYVRRVLEMGLNKEAAERKRSTLRKGAA